MQEVKDTQITNVSQWIFGKRLQIFGSQQEVVARTDNYHIHQDQFQGAKRYDSGLIGEINNQKDLKQVYKIFNSLVVRFRFNTKNLEQTSSKSRNELKNKKHLKDVENQFKSKIRRINEIMRIPKEQDEHWKNALNHKNVIQHVIKAKIFLKKYFETNFELIKQGGAHLKNTNLPKELQIYLCILAMDILALINTMIHLLYPFLQQQNNPSNNKVELQEKILLQNALENANESLQIEFLKSIDIQRFLVTIKRLANQIKGANYPFKVWISVQQIRQNYLVNKFGVSLKRFHPTAAKELMLFWMQVYNEHFNEKVIPKHESVCLKQVFSEYKIIFNYFLIEATKKQEEASQVVQYLDLIQKIWVKIDLNSASSIFWRQLQLALTNKKITLPADFVKNSRDFLMDIVYNIIRNFKKDRNQQYLQKLKQTALKFSMNLLNLEYDQDLTEHYFLKNEKQIRLLFTQRSILDQNLIQIRKKLEEEKDIIILISTITQKMVIDEKTANYMMAIKHEKEVIDNLYVIYRQDHALIDEIKYFLLLSRCLSNRSPSQQELQTCLKYYQSQRKGILTNEEQISSDQVNRLRFGLLDCIKNFTFQLVLNIKLNRPSGQLDKLKKIIYKLLKIYKQKRNNHQRNTKENDGEDEQQEIEVNSLLLRRSSSVNIDANWFHMQAEDLQGVQYEDENDDFTMNYLKKLFELRVQMIIKSIHELQIKEQPYREEFLNIKSRIYMFAANSEKDQQLRQDAKKLPQIQFDFIKGRYYEAWNELRKLKDIEGVNKILEKAWDGKRNLLKFFVIIFLKYKEPIFQTSLKGKDLEGKQIQQLMDEALKCEHRNMKIDSSLKQNIINSIRILDCIQKVYYLKKELMEQDEQISNMQEAKHYKLVREETKFNLIQDKVQIFAIMKNDVIIMRKYIIKLQPNQIQEVFKRLRKLTQFNRNISLQANKQKDTIVMKIDQIQNTFESYPKLIKFLIETYLEIIQFCHRQLNFQLYPLILHNHFKIYKKNDHNITLKMNPYEGILLNIISSYKDLKLSNDYKYPKYPFIQLADQLSRKFERDKIYDYKNANEAELHAFKHLITQMKALSMEIQSGNNMQIAKAILKCPYFWSSADKLFEIVEFKERYQSIVNIEESRRKENEKIRQSLSPEQKENFTYWPPEKKHPNYKLAYGYNKTDQVYFSIEGLLERQAFEQDIGKFKGNDTNHKYKFHGYEWSKDKTQIQRLVKMVAQREKKKGSNTSFYDKTFNSFQNQIRNLRNLSVHYIYDSDQKKEIDLEDKLRIFQTYFPKLFVFLYRWRPFLGKDYVNEIKPQKIHFLKQLFCKEDNSQIIARLSSIKELQTYNIKNNNSKNYLLQLFNYDFARVNSCEPCKILCNSLKKQNSFWGFLQDIKRQNYKQGKDMTYNLLFWDHDKKGCNGMVNLIMAYFNVTQRNQFTTEQFAHVKSSLIMMQIQKDRLQKKIKKKLEKMAEMKKNKTPTDNQEEDNSPGSDSESVEIQKNREPVDKRFKRLNARELDALYDQLLKLDYVCKYFIYQLEMEFPYLFHDLRNERYQWDERARQFPKKE